MKIHKELAIILATVIVIAVFGISIAIVDVSAEKQLLVVICAGLLASIGYVFAFLLWHTTNFVVRGANDTDDEDDTDYMNDVDLKNDKELFPDLDAEIDDAMRELNALSAGTTQGAGGRH